MAPSWAAGEVIAERFVIERLAGAGGNGVVYRALDRQRGQPVALKFLHGFGSTESAERFTRESRLLATLDHTGIVRHVADGVLPDGRSYLAMEWLEGESLSSRIERGLGVEDTITIAREVADALAAAHRRGVVHRDLKPGNLLLVGGRVDRVKIVDFGLARPVRSMSDLTQTGTMLGTPGYMAPEQARGERIIDARADVFSLGAILYKCLTGRGPFEGEDILAVLLKIVLDEAPRIADTRRGVPVALDALVARMLSKSPDDRPRDAGEVSEALRAIGPPESDPPSKISTQPPQLTGAERRVMCVVLAHLKRAVRSKGVTLTALGAREQAMREAIAAHGGRLDVLVSGALLVTMESRGAATDQAARAARCALAMHVHLPEAALALVTGRAVVSRRVPMGEVVDRGVELLRREGAEAIRIDELTAGLLDARFEIAGDADGLALRGEREVDDTARTLLGHPTEFVGRERELATLEALFDEVVSEQVARVVVVTGEAGLGKSRVRQELLGRITRRDEPVEIWMARGEPMRAGSPFGMIAPALRRAMGILDGEPPLVRQKKLRARVGRHLEGDDHARVSEFLCELVGAPLPAEDSVMLRAARESPMLMGDQMRRAWEDFLAAETSERPVVLVLEDLHWGDLPSVRFVDSALRSLHGSPLLVIAFARPEVHDIFPDLWRDRARTVLALGRLPRKGSERIVRAALGEASDAIVERLVQQATGNPFYLEELIRAVASGQRNTLPESVLAMVQARLEGLEPAARRVLRAASVFGQVFWRGGVAALLGGSRSEPRDWLALLGDREVIHARPTGKFPDEEEYAFRHAIVQECAYAMLTDPDRILGHRLAADWLERSGEGDAMILAEQFERGQLHERAIGWYRRAAEHALEGNDYAAVLARIDRAVVCGASGAVLGALRLVQAQAHKWRGDNGDARRAADDAARWLPKETPLWWTAISELGTATGKLGDRAALEALARDVAALPSPPEADAHRVSTWARLATPLLFLGGNETAELLLERIAEAEQHRTIADTAAQARVLEARAVRALCASDPGRYLDLSEAAAVAFERVGDLRSACLQRANLGSVYLSVGAYAEAERALTDALAAAERMGMPHGLLAARGSLGLTLARRGLLTESIELLDRALADSASHSDRRLEAGCRIYLAIALSQLGDLDRAEREIAAAADGLDPTAPLRAYALAVLADLALSRGHAAPALAATAEALRILERLGGMEEGESLLRLCHARALDASGDPAGARVALAEATGRVLERADKLRDPAMRESFLERVPDNAATLRLAAAWGIGGR